MFHSVEYVAGVEMLASHFTQPQRKPLSGDVWLTTFSPQEKAFHKSHTESDCVPGIPCQGSHFVLYQKVAR